MLEFTIENIHDQETIECLKVFDEELNIFLNQSPEWMDIDIVKYMRVEKEPNQSEIHMVLHLKNQECFLVFKNDYFEDYCYSKRTERNVMLNDTLERIKEKLK